MITRISRGDELLFLPLLGGGYTPLGLSALADELNIAPGAIAATAYAHYGQRRDGRFLCYEELPDAVAAFAAAALMGAMPHPANRRSPTRWREDFSSLAAMLDSMVATEGALPKHLRQTEDGGIICHFLRRSVGLPLQEQVLLWRGVLEAAAESRLQRQKQLACAS